MKTTHFCAAHCHHATAGSTPRIAATRSARPPSLMAGLIFALLAVLLLYKGYISCIEPRVATGRTKRTDNGTAPSYLLDGKVAKGLPDVGPRQHDPSWMAFERKLVQEVAGGDAGEGLEFVFYGDSITERWRGTEMDEPRSDGPACVKSFQKNFGKWRTALLAISGDQSGHLLWRLMHGEIPQTHTPRAAILLIGTNDLGLARKQRINPTDVAPEAVQRLTAIVGLLRERLPGVHVLVVAVLPRGFVRRDYSWPNKFTKGVDLINEQMMLAAAGQANVTFVNCNKGFMRGNRINKDLMPDALHPNPAGMDVLAKCYKAALREAGLLPGKPRSVKPRHRRD